MKNIAFGMRMKKRYTKTQIRERVAELLALDGLEVMNSVIRINSQEESSNGLRFYAPSRLILSFYC
jgi:ABC-type Fe3+/spermidine/putrescine transport system ATPase subunit